MTESEFLGEAEAVLSAIEAALERITEGGDVDVECSRSGNVLEIEFIDSGAKIIVNIQAAMQEIWVAARSGGFHYRRDNGRWLDTRSGKELFVALLEMVTQQGGAPVTLR